MNYYTYIYIDPIRNIPRYVGYGHGDRAYSHLIKSHNKSFAGWLRDLKDKGLVPKILKENCVSKETAKIQEIFWISIYGRLDIGTGCLFNHTDGGEGSSGLKHSQETKDEMSRTRKGRVGPMVGKTHSQETRDRMSEAHSGKNNHFYGKTHTQDTKDRQSEIMKGRMTGDKNPFYGKKHSVEKQEEITEKLRGQTRSSGIREKMSGKVLVVDFNGRRYYISRKLYHSQSGPREEWDWIAHKSKLALLRNY